MAIEETLTAAETNVGERAAEPFSPNWWHGRSSEELRALLDRGFGSAAFEGATAEMERRAREDLRDEDRAAQATAAHKKSLRLGILEAVLLGCLLTLIAVLLLR